MDSAVDLDGEPPVRAVDVKDERPDAVLPSEFESVQPPGL